MLKSLPDLDLRIHYATARDGVNIAYWTAGAGEPLVFLPTLVSNVESDWRSDRGKVYARLAENHLLVRFDGRGHGMSDRNPASFSLETLIEDLEAVVDELGLRRFAIMAPTIGATTAIAFAARFPKRVTKLVLFHPYPSFNDYFQSTFGDALPLVRQNWELFTMTVSHIRMGWLQGDQARNAAALMRDSVDQAFFLREVETAPQLNARPLMANVKAPTLIVCRRHYGEYEIAVARSIAAAISTASFELVDGNSNGIWDDRQQALREIERFLGVEDFSTGPATTLPDYLHNRSHDLSPREVDVLRFLASGQRNKEIAADLGLSVYTVARHVATIYAKIGAHGRAEATRYALEHGILSTRETAGVR
jgi:pimeloyl-ACP methyl ester carboxylesterase/DNA-binding CsgD family transcriptional regulator